jgi:hypothetical protein
MQAQLGQSASLGPIAALMAGGFLFGFTILLLVCAKDGVMTLQWKTSVWPIYLLLSLPALFWGWRELAPTQTLSEVSQKDSKESP